jgi:mRNA-degrading endonuclease HigB of HigAB toxin-antitoxin module
MSNHRPILKSATRAKLICAACGGQKNASILKRGRVVFNIKANDYRLVKQVNYVAGTVEIRFIGTHAEYDRIDAEVV